MKPEKDAYGQLIRDYLNKKEAQEIVERDDGFVDISSGAPAYFQDFKDWPKHQKEAIKFTKGRVLDIGAGAGRVSLYLQKRRFDVVAIDNSSLAIKVCKKRGVKKTKLMSIDEIYKFKPNSLDTIIMFGNNFGLFGSFKKARKLLKKLYRITSKNALIIAESNDPYKTDKTVHLQYHKLNKKRGRMAGQLRFRIRFEKYIGDWLDYLLVSKKEMKGILKNTGWKVKKFIDSEKSSYIAIIEK
jgi:ubiquinone/menaquinone biosynthesis C-methylase UbiE